MNAYLVKPYDDQLVGDDLTIAQIMEVLAHRHEIAHTDIRSAFLVDKCSESEFIAAKILPHLKSITTLKRMT